MNLRRGFFGAGYLDIMNVLRQKKLIKWYEKCFCK